MSVSDSLKYDFDYKNEILAGCFDEVNPFTFYETVFSDKDIYTDTCIVSYGSNEKMPLVKANPIEKTTKTLTIEEMITSSVDYGNVYVAPASFFRDCNITKCLKSLYAIVVDFDGDKRGVSVDLLKWLLERIFENEDDLPSPTFVTNSGKGLHLFWVFEKPVPMFNENKRVMSELYKAIHQKLADYNAKPQKHHFAQAYRVVGSRTKLNQTTTAFKTGEVLPAETLLRDFGIKKAIIWNEGKKKEKMEPSESMLKLAENIEKTLGVVCEDKDDWDYVHKYISDNKKAFTETFKLNQSERFRKNDGAGWGSPLWYATMKDRIIRDTPEGNRYTSLMALTVIGYKCNIPFETVKKDIDEIIIKWQIRPKSFEVRFHDEYRNRIDNMYSEKFKKVRKVQLEEWLGFKMTSSSKRNGRKRAEHIKLMNFVRDELNQNKTWNKEGNGRKPKKDIVQQWRLENPDGKKADCIRDTGLTKPTVYKWWDKVEIEN
jgi:hypothetical protein